MCRALGEAVKSGWKPRRTIVYASWDAEEFGLVGSTEWAEEHEKQVDKQFALLLNVDSAVSGRELDFGGVPALRDLALDASGAVTDVRSGKPLRDVWLESKRSAWATASPLNLHDPLWDEDGGGSANHQTDRSRREFFPQMHPLGSGSDYTVFLDHLGVPALDIGFSGRYGVYHSIYDNFTWMEKFGDPEFLTHTMAARLYTVLIMRAAAAEVIPFRFVPYGEALRDHVDELRLINARQVRSKPKESGTKGEATRPAEQFEGLPALLAAVKDFQRKAGEVDRGLDEVGKRDTVSRDRLDRINAALARVERAFLLPKGLAGRSWFKHAVYAPGVTTGYGAWPFPAIRQALEEHKPDRIGPAVAETVQVLQRAAAALDEVLAAVRESPQMIGD
jgi:N-acetylated-alpha-linked acidic dipeptidase